MPIKEDTIKGLRTGDHVLLSGEIYTGRDAALWRMVRLLEAGETLPFEINGQAIYYAGPCPAPPGRPIGSVGPTTSGRMDVYTPQLIQAGLRVMIGKGPRNASVMEAIRAFSCVYFAAIGGAGALMALCVENAELIAFDDLGPEAIYKLTMRDMPLVVAADSLGGDIYDRKNIVI